MYLLFVCLFVFKIGKSISHLQLTLGMYNSYFWNKTNKKDNSTALVHKNNAAYTRAAEAHALKWCVSASDAHVLLSIHVFWDK